MAEASPNMTSDRARHSSASEGSRSPGLRIPAEIWRLMMATSWLYSGTSLSRDSLELRIGLLLVLMLESPVIESRCMVGFGIYQTYDTFNATILLYGARTVKWKIRESPRKKQKTGAASAAPV